MGLSIPTLSTGIMISLPPARAGMGSGLNSAAREIGSALGCMRYPNGCHAAEAPNFKIILTANGCSVVQPRVAQSSGEPKGP